jgi:two-component system chemotaxis sensor kinase CheA
MDDLINDFVAESREMLDALGGAVVAWEAAPEDRERLDEIFRFVHTIKGNSGFFDLPRLGALSHAAEDALAEVRTGRRAADARLVSAVLAVIDRIGELVHALETGEPAASASDEGLIEALKGTAEEVLPAETGKAQVADQRGAIRSIRLPVDLLDRMMGGVSDMVLARNELARRLREAPPSAAVTEAFERVSGCIADMRDAIMRTRMQRIDNLFQSLPRLVRDLSAELGKPVDLSVDGGDVELDREMIETIRDPLTHLIRNAIDHGLEGRAERIAAGKPAQGSLKVCARQSGNQILIEIADDGRGIDGERLVERAIAAGIVTPEQGERMSPAQRYDLMFRPGLSTAREVTAISGRGVGMDVVRANVERIGGMVEIDSRRGQGVRLTLRVPLTLTIIPALTVSAGGQVYAIPRSSIEEIVRCRSAAVRVERVAGAEIASIRGKRLPLVSLPELLGVETKAEPIERSLIVLKPAGGGLYALAVDEVHDHEELVVKPAAPLVMATGLYAGTTLADDGAPILLLDASGLAAQAGVPADQSGFEVDARANEPAKAGETAPALLFRGLDGSRKLVRLAVVERIDEVPASAAQRTAGRLRVTVGDQILPLAGCGDRAPDQGFRLLRLSDGSSEIAYGFAEVIDLIEFDAELQPAPGAGEVSGVVLIGSEQVEILDPYWLFAAEADGRGAIEDRPVCSLPAGDAWMANILRPIVESAGYRVLFSDQAGADRADLAITGAETGVPAPQAGEIIRLRASADGEGDGSIYRYDRAALLAALTRQTAGRKG